MKVIIQLVRACHTFYQIFVNFINQLDFTLQCTALCVLPKKGGAAYITDIYSIIVPQNKRERKKETSTTAPLTIIT